jgi:hypothetical protein
MALGMATGLRNARLDAISTFAGSGAIIRVYDGTRPATGGTATTKLAELSISGALAAAASGGALTMNAITQDSSADNTGTATWARILKSDGTTFVADCSVGTSGADINFATVSFVAGAAIQITSFVLTEGNA